MPRADRRSQNMTTVEPPESRLRSDGILHTKLVGRVSETDLKALQMDLTGRLDAGPLDWILDFTGVTEIEGKPNAALTNALMRFKAGGGRHLALIVNERTSMFATSSSLGANAGGVPVTNLEEALGVISARRGEVSP